MARDSLLRLDGELCLPDRTRLPLEVVEPRQVAEAQVREATGLTRFSLPRRYSGRSSMLIV